MSGDHDDGRAVAWTRRVDGPDPWLRGGRTLCRARLAENVGDLEHDARPDIEQALTRVPRASATGGASSRRCRSSGHLRLYDGDLDGGAPTPSRRRAR